MVEAIHQEERNNERASMYGGSGPQPRSLFINWMKYDVTDENVHPNSAAAQQSDAVRLSPLRQKLQARAEQVHQKRQLLTTSEIENRIQEARLRRDNASQEAVIRRVEPKMRRAEAQHSRQTYLSEMARKRHSHEESIVNQCQQNIQRIR